MRKILCLLFIFPGAVFLVIATLIDDELTDKFIESVAERRRMR